MLAIACRFKSGLRYQTFLCKSHVSRWIHTLPFDALLRNHSVDKIILTNEQFDAFCEICENPPTPGLEIHKAAKTLDEEGFFPHEGN